MSVKNTSVGVELVDQIEYVEYGEVDIHKPWLGMKEVQRFIVPDSILTRSGINVTQSGNETNASSTQGNLVTAMDYDFKQGAIILDHWRKESYSIKSKRKSHNNKDLGFFAYRIGLEWIDAYSKT